MTVADLKKMCQDFVNEGRSHRGFFLWLGDDAHLTRELAPLPVQSVDVEALIAGPGAGATSDEVCRDMLEAKLKEALRPFRERDARTILAITNPLLLARYKALTPITNALSESLMVIIALPKQMDSKVRWPDYVRFEPTAAPKFFTKAVGGDENVVHCD